MSYSGDLYGTDAGLELTTKGDLHGHSASANVRVPVGTNNYVLTADSTNANGIVWLDASAIKHANAMEVACSDESTAITVGTAKCTFRLPFGMELNAGEAGFRASLTGAGSTSGDTTIDCNQNGSTILTTKCTINYSDLTSVGATVPVVIGTTTLTDNAEITIDVDGITGGADETGLKIQLIGTLT